MISSTLTQAPDSETSHVLITSVRLNGLPEGSPPFQFRCRLISHGLDGALVLEQFTQASTQPDWLVNFLHSGVGRLSVSVHLRMTSDSEWRDVGSVNAQPAEALKGEPGVVTELPVAACRFAPDFRVELQFSKIEPAS